MFHQRSLQLNKWASLSFKFEYFWTEIFKLADWYKKKVMIRDQVEMKEKVKHRATLFLQ